LKTKIVWGKQKTIVPTIEKRIIATHKIVLDYARTVSAPIIF